MLIAEKDASGATIATYLYDHAGHPVSMTRGGKTYYYHYNAHGDTIALTDDSGNIAARYAYDIWGNIISKEGDIANPFTYGGQWGYIHDDESGLYFLKTRYYDPSIGRFISRDRFAGFENDPDSQNRYVYCGNDPVNNVDPSGEIWWWIAAGISGAVSAFIDYWFTHRNIPFRYWNKRELAWSMARGALISIGLGAFGRYLVPAMLRVVGAMFQIGRYADKRFVAIGVFEILKKYNMDRILIEMVRNLK